MERVLSSVSLRHGIVVAVIMKVATLRFVTPCSLALAFQTIITHGLASHKAATVILALSFRLPEWQQEEE